MSGMAHVFRRRAPWRWIGSTPDSIEFPKLCQYLPTGLGTGTRLWANPPCTDSAYHFLLTCSGCESNQYNSTRMHVLLG